MLRYATEDDFGLPKTAFNVCTFWLIEALHFTGRDEDARALFERLMSLRNEPVLLVHQHDLADIGVTEGTSVRVTSARGTITLPVATHPSVPAGTARLSFTADGRGAAELVDTASMVTDLRVETIRDGGARA